MPESPYSYFYQKIKEHEAHSRLHLDHNPTDLS